MTETEYNLEKNKSQLEFNIPSEFKIDRNKLILSEIVGSGG